MGLLNKFKDFNQSRQQKKVEKFKKLVSNKKAIKEDRAAAIDYFNYIDEPEIAVSSLMPRFEYSIEQSIIDTREKESAMRGIVRHKDQALPYIVEHLKTTSFIAWPVKLIAEITEDETQLRDLLLEVLDYGDISFDQAAVEKNFDVLCYLADYKLPGLATKLSQFLQNPDERVRYACVEVLVNQDDPEVKTLLEPFLTDDTSENRRIRMAVIDAFVKNSWRVEDPKKFDAGLITEGVFVTKKGNVERRN